MNCPYDKRTLRLTALEVDSKLTDEKIKKLEEIVEKQNTFNDISDKQVLNERVSKENGVSVVELINSPNYEKLIDEYTTKLAYELIEQIKSKVGFSDKEAWTLLVLAVYGESALTNA
jgi:hypothetical protein